VSLAMTTVSLFDFSAALAIAKLCELPKSAPHRCRLPGLSNSGGLSVEQSKEV